VGGFKLVNISEVMLVDDDLRTYSSKRRREKGRPDTYGRLKRWILVSLVGLADG
jgi:hypothetical protein